MKSRTLEEIRRDGLAALREKLGVAGMIHFLQQFEQGKGDYIADRREWADKTTFDDIRLQLKKLRRKPRKAG
ncbi:MAG TPA: hypothetical protein VHY37_02775 [Tepidisphaeraceae bacterium]|jgi:hypothetical protein|nr:hypothetical protein [Tepidisphaeraceae bacterium]